MKKRFLGFILSVLMVAGTINPAVLNAKTTINPQEFINSAFRRPGDDLDLQPTDEDGNPKIKGFDKSLAYMSERKESEEPAPEENTESSSEESTTESSTLTQSTTEQPTEEKSTEESKEEEIKTVDKKYWKNGKEHTDFLSTVKELEKQLKKKSKDFTINVSFDCNTIKKYRESTWSAQNSQKDSKSGEAKDVRGDEAKDDKDPEEDERKDSDLVLAMVHEALFSNRDNKELTKEDLTEEELVDGLENSVGSETKERLTELGVTALAQETKDDEILVGRFYTTLHYEPVYEGEDETTTEKTEEQKSEEKESITEQKEKTTEESSEQQKESEVRKDSEGTTLAQNTTESAKESDKKKKSKTQSGISMQAIDNAPETDVTINFLTAQFISGAKKEKNQWVWTPVNATSDHMFVFRINYSTSGVADVPAGGFKITVPKQILRERNGDFADFFTMSLPQKDDEVDDTDENSEYAWKIDGDNIVIYNCKEITAAQNGYFDIGYSTDKETYYYRDMGESEPFFGTLEIDGKTATTDKIHVVINTQATIDYTNKYYPDLYRDWNDSWGTKPADADDYYYLVWMIGTNINHTTQNYNFTLEDNVTSKDGKVELVGYKMSGSDGFSQVNTVSNIHSEGIRYDYVLTKHLKSDFDPKLTYKIENNIKATVDPVDQVDPDTDAVASREFKWERPVFHIPTGRFTIWKYGDENWYRRFGYHRDYSSYELAEFKEGKKTTLNDLNYMVWAAGFPAPWTLEKGKYSDDPEAYYKNPVTYTITDDVLYLVDPTDTRLSNEVLDDDDTEGLTPLAPEDYDIKKLTFRMAAKDGSYDDFNKDFETSTHTANENDVLTFQIKVDNEWKNAGTVNLGTGEVKIEDDHVKFLDTTQIQFNNGVKGWRMSATNAYYESNFYVYPYVDLHRTDNTLALVDGEDMVILKNTTNLTVTYDKDFDGTSDDEIVSLNRVIGDRIRQIEKDSSLDKRAITSSNNVRKKYYDVGWRVDQSEVMTTGKGEKEYIRQNGGTFYDLLPKGSAFKKGTLSVKTDEGTLKESQYSYELKADWRQSGRIMLIVRIKPQAKWYSVYYHTQHSWDSIKDYGKDVKNPVAYETGNNEITNGYPDNGGKLSIDKDLMSDLDETTDDPKFLYSEDAHWINALTAAISGLDKKVMTSDDSDWSYETFTHPDGIYQYRWRFANNFVSSSKNMIFFDSLENYVVKTGEKSDWHGTLQRIDTSQLESKGIQPIIYISEQSNLDLDQHHDLTDTSIWKRVDHNTDLSKAKAVVIDVRKKIDGTDFIMKAGESINAVLYMKAPSTVQEDLHRYPVTYNNIYIEDTVIDSDGGTYDYFIHQDYTKVKYRITGDFSLDKVSSENIDEKIEGIKFRLTGTSDFGTEVNEIRETDQDGHIDFKGIEKGEYILQEYGSLPDWLEDHTEHKVIIHGDRSVTIDGEKKSNVVITNKPRIHADISFVKTDLIKKTKKLPGAKFKLWGTSDYGNEVIKYATSEADGKVTFENVELGTYKLKEIEAPEGYIIEKKEYVVVVDKNANFSITYPKKQEKVSTTKTVKKYAHTSNVSDDGVQNGNYSNNLAETKVITIPGATSLNVKITWGGESASWDWVCAWEGNHKDYTASSNYSSSFTGKLGGGNHTNDSNTKEFTINGDTVTFAFKSDGSGCGDGYGYWAEVSATIDTSTTRVVKYSHTPNVSDDGTQNSNYTNNLTKTEVITIPGASSLNLKITWGGESDNYDWVCVWEGAHANYTAKDNYSSSFTGKLGGGDHTSDSNTKEFIVNGDTVTISYRSDGSGYGDGYGYWAEVTGIIDKGAHGSNSSSNNDPNEILELDKHGNMLFYNEPLHDIRLVKKSSYDGNTVAGASFSLVGTSDYDTKVNLTATSETNGFVDFKGLEAGSYVLQEITAPDGFRLDNTKRTVTITKMGDITISGIAQNKYGNFDITNQKIPDGQVIVIKKWKDKKKPEERTMPTIQISGKKPEITYSGEATVEKSQWSKMESSLSFDTGKTFQKDDGLYTVKSFLKKHPNAKKVDDGTTEKSIYVYKDDENNFYWWTDAEKAYLAEDSSLMFQASNTIDGYFDMDFSSIDLNGFDTSKVITMSYMFFGCSSLTSLDMTNFDTSKVTTMSHMFYYCSSLTTLDLSNFNTSKVTDMSSMFDRCNKLTSLDVINFDTSKVTSMSNMFYKCNSLIRLDVINFDTSNVTTMYCMFYECSGLISLDVTNFETSKVTYMRSMFCGCSKLTSLDVTNFDVSNVTDIGSMFSGCSGLTSLDVTNFDTSQVTNMSSMFYGCNKLTSLDVTNFNTSKVTDMSYMFYICSGLTNLDITNFDTSKVTRMDYMFSGCSKLTSLDVTNFDTSQVTGMNSMFSDCSKLTSLDVTNFDTSKVTNMSSMFSECSGLTTLDVTHFDTSKVTKMNGMFEGCSKLTSLDVTNFDTSKVTGMAYMFHECSSLISLDVTNFDTSKVTTMDTMFSGCSKLTSLDVTNFDTSKLTNIQAMFYGCSSITNIYVSEKWSTDKVTASNRMFYQCTNLPNFDSSKTDKTNAHYGPGGYLTYKASITASLGSKALQALAQLTNPVTVYAADNIAEGTSGTCTWTIFTDGELVIKPTNGEEGILASFSGDYNGAPWYDYRNKITSARFEGKVFGGRDCSSMFFNCSSLTSLDLSNFDTSNVTDMGYMFSGCSGLTSLDVTNFDTSKVTDMFAMFDSCSRLSSLDVTNFNTSKVTDMSSMFNSCWYLYELDLSNFDTSNVTDMRYMFMNCFCLHELQIINFNTSKVTNMSEMFYDCSRLEQLQVINFDTSKVTNMSEMFGQCCYLEELNLINFDTSNVTNMYQMFFGCESLKVLDLNGFNVSKVENMTEMFLECSNLEKLLITSWRTSSLTTLAESDYSCGMFESCSSLESIDLSNFDVSQVTDLRCMFRYCDSLRNLDLSTFNTSNVESMAYMFKGCTSLTSLDLLNFDTSKVIEMSGMFSDCSGLTCLDITGFNTGEVIYMDSMFSGCGKLIDLDISNFNTKQVTDMSSMFYECMSFTTLDLSSFETSVVTNMDQMFYNCSNLSILKLGKNFKSLKNTNLPTPSPIGTEEGQYTGKWTRGTPYNHADALTSSDFMNTYSGDTMADTWYWEKNGQDPAEQTYTSISNRVFNPADFTITDDMTQEQKDALTAARDALLAQYQIEDSDGNAGYWTHIDDNTDMYTFYVYDPNIEWNVWEEDIDGDYNTNHDITNPYVLASDATDKTATITNTIPEEDISAFGNLSITKRVVNWDDSDIKDSREFTFKITLTDADGNALEGNKVYGNTAFINGKATITLTDDETVEFSDIPAGYLYKVEEVTPSGYTFSMTGDTGTITKEKTAEVIATNKKDKPTEDEENPKYTSFTLTKKLTGNFEEKSESYKFQIALTGLAPLTTYSLSNGKTFNTDENGTADVEVTLAPDESITVENIPVGAKYTITEDAGDYFSSYEITDASKLGKIQKSKDSNSEKNKALSTSQETADDGEAITVTYSNRIQDVQDLKLAKKVVNSKGTEVKDNGQYEVTIHFEDMEPNSSFDSDLGPIQADDDGIAELTTYVKNGDVINFSQVPVGVSYKFTESANDKIASYIVSDSNNIGKINSVKDGNDVEQKELSTAKEVVNKGENVTVTFINAKAIMGSLKLIKKDGNKLLKGVTFTLAKSDGTEIGTATTNENGEVLFDELEEGTYTVTEKQTTKGHSLLTEPFTVTIPYTIKKDKAEEANMDTSKAVLMGDTYYYYDLTYTVDNSHTLNLPKTGVDGRSYVWVTFAIAAIISVEYYLATRKRKRKAKHD